MTIKEYLNCYNDYHLDDELKEKVIEYNKALVEEYPFLLPHNRWTDKVNEDYDYTYTELDSLEPGWRLAFSEDLLKDLKEELIKINHLDNYRIIQIKEKYGGLRWYDNGCTENWHEEILPKYTKMSYHTCGFCGKPAKYTSTSWIYPYCEGCVKDTSKKMGVKVEDWFEEIDND